MRNTEKKVYTFMFDNGAESGVVAFEPTKGHKKIIFATNILVQNHDLTNMQKSIISKTVKKSRPQGKMCTRKNGKEIYLIYTVKLPDIFGFRHKERCYEMLINLSLIHISEPTRLGMISYAVFCLKKKKNKK